MSAHPEYEVLSTVCACVCVCVYFCFHQPPTVLLSGYVAVDALVSYIRYTNPAAKVTQHAR